MNTPWKPGDERAPTRQELMDSCRLTLAGAPSFEQFEALMVLSGLEALEAMVQTKKPAL